MLQLTLVGFCSVLSSFCWIESVVFLVNKAYKVSNLSVRVQLFELANLSCSWSSLIFLDYFAVERFKFAALGPHLVNFQLFITVFAPQLRAGSGFEIKINAKGNSIFLKVDTKSIDLIIDHVNTNAFHLSKPFKHLLATIEVLSDPLGKLPVLLSTTNQMVYMMEQQAFKVRFVSTTCRQSHGSKMKLQANSYS